MLIIVENLPVLRDPRVRRECRALVERGFAVSVICPALQAGSPQRIDGVDIEEYPPFPQPRGKLGFVLEYTYSFVAAAILTIKVLVTRGVDVLQACNPPDIYFFLALPLKLLGKPFVFDHHDLTPELYASRYGKERGVVVTALRALERATFLAANHVISTNDSFKDVAVSRGRKMSEDVTVVRNGPELARLAPRSPRVELKHGKKYLCCWAGTVAPQYGVELALDACRRLVHEQGRRDSHFTFLGDGESLNEMRLLAADFDIEFWVTFTGWVDENDLFDHLATADLGLQPHPKDPRTDVSTAGKVMDYMAFSIPTVAFDLVETRVSAGPAAVYVAPNDTTALARAIDELLGDPDRRARMGRIGRRRIEESLAWDHQKVGYVAVYEQLLGRKRR